MLQVYVENKELTDPYFGDYAYVLSNYLKFTVPETKHNIVQYIIPKASADNNKKLAQTALKFLINGDMQLSNEELIKYFNQVL